MYRAREFAELAGVTVRALHHYDRLGLLKPRKRSAAGYRLYELDDLQRLEQIVALKYVGLSLKDIGELLERDPGGLKEALGRQRQLLTAKRTLLERAIRAVCEAEAQLQVRGAPGVEALRKIIQVIEMDMTEDWTSKYATEKGRPKIEARKRLWSPELQERVSHEWGELIADVESALEEDPGGERGQKLAERWNGLLAEFTGRDPDVERSVANVWAHRDEWPAEVGQKVPVIRREVWEFIARAKGLRG